MFLLHFLLKAQTWSTLILIKRKELIFAKWNKKHFIAVSIISLAQKY